MFLSTRMFFARHKISFIVMLVAYGLLISTNTLLFASILQFALGDTLKSDDVSLIVWFSFFMALYGIYTAFMYCVWVIKYHYFFRLHAALSRLQLTGKRTLYRLPNGTLTIKDIDRAHRISFESYDTVRIATIGSDYFSEKNRKVKGGARPTERHLGPLRGVGDAKTFKRWCGIIASARHIEPETYVPKQPRQK